ncbi:efflux RND transporter periplasmic adaptor subunit [Paucibacter soli]|uniref:efflux RND transporter periplasmic adaptor subunit n=1 Tax=Paucibacter soli TaxID=3133433 RepID=UPI00309769E0
MRSAKPIALTALLIALGGATWWWTRAPAPATPAAGKAAAPQSVGVVKALRQDVPVALEASGTVTALNHVDLRAQTTSTVREVLVKDGQMVRKGALLFRFDDRADRAGLDRARAQAARSRASLADLERQYQRARELLAQHFVAQNAVDTALANLEAQRAQLQADEAALQSAQVALSYNELHAPLSGRAGIVSVVAGSLVQANAAALPLVSIAQIDPIGVSFSLPETQLGPLLDATRQGQAAGLEVQLQLPGATPAAAAKLLGRVSFVDNSVDASTGTIKVRADFENARATLWPGQYVRVRVTLRTLKDAVVIPQAAIILRGNERSVYVVDADKTARLLPVQLRHAFGELAVVEGIAPGATVVLDGKQNLRPGTPVQEQAAAVNPAAAAKKAFDAASGAAK